MIEAITKRIEARLNGESYDNAKVSEMGQTIIDRLCLRLHCTEDNFPTAFYGIAAEATVKCYRRLYYEGIQSENVSGLSTSFVNDVLNEYQSEIDEYLKINDGVVKFL